MRDVGGIRIAQLIEYEKVMALRQPKWLWHHFRHRQIRRAGTHRFSHPWLLLEVDLSPTLVSGSRRKQDAGLENSRPMEGAAAGSCHRKRVTHCRGLPLVLSGIRLGTDSTSADVYIQDSVGKHAS